MSAGELAVIGVVLILLAGTVGEYGPRWIVAVRELERERLGRVGDLYPATVVHTAVRGALIAHTDLEDDAADRTADLVVDELERNDCVFDGHEWRALAVRVRGLE